MSLQVELLEQSFNYIKPYGNQFVSKFYKNLFETHPETESLFISIDSKTRNNQLWDDLVLIMENLRQPDILKNILQALEARLSNHGLLAEHYLLARDTLLLTCKQFLGDAWTAEFEQAWQDAYVTFRQLMLEGTEQARGQTAHPNPVAELEKTTEAEKVVVVAEPEKSLVEDFTPTFVTKDSILEEEGVAASTEHILLEEFLPTPVSNSEEILEEEVKLVTNAEPSLTENMPSTSMSESVDTVEEEVIIVESTDNSLEKTIMPESDKNISQNDITLDQSDDLLAEDAVEIPLADLSEKQKSLTNDPHFTQIFSPESQPESAATATTVKSVASETNYEPESTSSQSNKKLLIGGGIIGAIGLLLLVLL